MAHMIENNEIAYKGETPWHGLGTPVAPDATGIQMLDAAGLNWQVQLRTIAMGNPAYNAQTNPGVPKLLQEPLKDYKAVVRSDNQRVFQVASKRYQPVQNQEIVDFFREYAEAGKATVDVVGALKGGAKIWALAKLNASDTDLGGGDIVKPYIFLATAHDGTGATIGKATQVRVVCHNTWQAALADGKTELRIRHSRKWTKELADAAKQQLGVAVETVEKMNSLASQFAKVRVDGRGRVELLRKLLNKPLEPVADVPEPTQAEVDAVFASVVGSTVPDATDDDVKALGRVGMDILEYSYSSPGSDLVTAKDTLWGVLNGVTYYVDHIASRNQDNRLASAWMGQGATLKDKAVAIAQDMAGIKA